MIYIFYIFKKIVLSAAAFELLFYFTVAIVIDNNSYDKSNDAPVAKPHSLATLLTNVKSQLSVESYRKWLHLCDLIC